MRQFLLDPEDCFKYLTILAKEIVIFGKFSKFLLFAFVLLLTCETNKIELLTETN